MTYDSGKSQIDWLGFTYMYILHVQQMDNWVGLT